MSGLFGGSSKPPPPPPQIDHAAVQAAGAAERSRLRAASGRASTMLTGGLGVTDTANVAVKKLLGQ